MKMPRLKRRGFRFDFRFALGLCFLKLTKLPCACAACAHMRVPAASPKYPVACRQPVPESGVPWIAPSRVAELATAHHQWQLPVDQWRARGAVKHRDRQPLEAGAWRGVGEYADGPD